MKVYIVMFNGWEENIFLGMFSSMDKAKSYIENKYPEYEFDNETGYWIKDHGKSIDIDEAVLDEENLHDYI